MMVKVKIDLNSENSEKFSMIDITHQGKNDERSRGANSSRHFVRIFVYPLPTPLDY
jgi:hypothetical protein